MDRRLGRWTTALGVIGALVLTGAIYQASRSPSQAEARATDIQLEQAVKATQTPVGLMSPEAWAEREQLLRTDEQALAYAQDFSVLLRAILPVSDPATFYQNPTLSSVKLVRGFGEASVWEASYKVEVGSNESTFTVVYPSVTRFGPGLTPADKPPAGTDDVYVFANLQYFTKDQRLAFLKYWKSERLKDVHMAARLDREFPGAPWYEDTQVRASLLESGKKEGLGPSDLAYYFLDHQRTGTLIGYDSATETWRELEVTQYPYAKWYARMIATEAAEKAAQAERIARVTPVAKPAAKAKAKAAAAKTTPAKPAAAAAPATTPSKPAAAPTASSPQQPTEVAQQPASGSTQQPASATQPLESGGTIPDTATPWYNVLLLGLALMLGGMVGVLRYAAKRHA